MTVCADSTEPDNGVELVYAMEETPVLVVGDIMLDRFVYGHVSRISPESPVPVLSIERENKMLGGAGNTLSNLHYLGAKPHIISVIGDDEKGREIKDMLTQWDIDSSGLIVASDRPTIVKTRYLAGHQQLLRTDDEHLKPIAADVEAAILDAARARLRDMKALVISDYGKGMLSKTLLSSLISAAHAAGVPVLVDPKGADHSIYKNADIITPNKKELSEATNGRAVETDDEVVDAARTLLKTSGVKIVVATRSQDGMSVISADDVYHVRSAKNIEVFDVSGAGDTVIATIAAAVASGTDIKLAAALANIAGSIVVSKVGTAPIRRSDLIDFVSVNGIDGEKISSQSSVQRTLSAPVATIDHAKEEVQRWRARGLKVGFTNGCFDILHYGHVTYLNDAREKCDRLILGLNRDSSIRILKGPERPVHDENSRASVLAALGAVDLVVMFGAQNEGDDNTACNLLEALQPDVYFKGGDYTVDQIPEAPTVMKYGGTVDVMPVYDGHSTTNSIKKMKG